jgi:hypothetical protein
MALVALIWGNCWAQASLGDRLALVIGNAAYKTDPLPNTRNDATGMAELLTKAGFKVDLRVDASQEQFHEAVTKFGQQIRSSKVKLAVFYYAGHGMQLNSRNYLVPVNANIRSINDVLRQTVDVTDLLRYMEEIKDRSLIVILDACRDAPSIGVLPSGNKGLSPYNPPGGTLLAYATGPGQVALDGTGKNGLYTKHLLRELAAQGETLLDGFMRVRVGVMTESQGKQMPWELSSLTDRELSLFPGERKSIDLSARMKLDDQESAEWLRLRSSAQAPVVDEVARFLRSYPNGITAEQAQFLLKRLWAQEIAQEAGTSALLADQQHRANEKAEAARIRAEAAESQRVAALQAQAARDEASRVEAAQLEMARQAAAAKAAQQAENARLAGQRALEAQQLAQAQAALAEAERRAATHRELEAARAKAAQAAVEQEAAAKLASERALASQREAEKAQLATEVAARVAAFKAQETRLEIARLDAEREQAQAARRAAAAEQAELKAASAVPAALQVAQTPYFQGLDEYQRRYQVGDQFQFQVIDGFTKVATRLDTRVTAVDLARDRVEYNNGEYVSDLMGNIKRNLRGDFDTVRQFYPANLFVGKQWRTHFKQTRANGTVYTFRYDLKVVGKERVTVPAGTFDTYKIEARGANMELGYNLQRNIWVAPGVNADIVHEQLMRKRNGQIDQHERQELVRYPSAPTPTQLVGG